MPKKAAKRAAKKPAAKKAAKRVATKGAKAKKSADSASRGSRDELTIIVAGGVVSECLWRSGRPTRNMPVVVVHDFDRDGVELSDLPLGRSARVTAGGTVFVRSYPPGRLATPHDDGVPYVEDEHDVS